MAGTQEEVIEQITEQAMDTLRLQENLDVDGLLQAWQTAKDSILSKIQASFPGETWSLVEMQGGRAAQMLQQINQEISRLIATSTSATTEAAAQQFQDSSVWSAYNLDQVTPPNIAVNLQLAPMSSVQALVSTPFQGAQFSQRYGAVGDAMASDIRDELTQSMINGESMSDAAARLDDVMGNAGRGYTNRTLTIARTEIMRAQTLGQWNTYEVQNKDLMAGPPLWHTTADDRLCPWCLGRDGKTAAQAKQLHLAARGKSDPFRGSGTMPLHPNCRCAWLPQVKSWKDLGIDIPEDAPDNARSMRGEDGKWTQVPVETFDAWQQRRGALLGLQR